MDRLKWTLLSLVAVWVLLEALLLGYRVIDRRNRPPARSGARVATTPAPRAEEGPEAEVLFREVARFGLDLKEPRDLAARPDGRIVVAGDRRLLEMMPDGAVSGATAVPSEPLCLAVDSSNNTYAGSGDHIAFFPAGSTNGAAWASPSANAHLTSLSVGAGGVFAADYGGRCVWRYDLSGRLLGRFGRGEGAESGQRFIVPTPDFVVVAGDESVWIANPGRRRIEEYSIDGTFERSWGEASARIEGFCGRANPGHFARLPDGRFVTSEKGLRRVKLYDGDGLFLGMVAPDGAFGRGGDAPPVAAGPDGQVFVLDPRSREIRIYVEKSPDADPAQSG